MESPQQQQQRVLFRFEFTEEFKTNLANFAREHENKHRKVFKEEWEKWCKINEDVITDEKHRLVEHGFTGDIYEKMFMSVRYYFRKKIQKDKCVLPKETPPPARKKYSYLDKQMFELIDTFIVSLQKTLSPSEAFSVFAENHKQQIISSMDDTEEIQREQLKIHVEKIKKTFKNLYYKKFSV